MSVRLAVFDCDGTLVDSNDAHAHSWVDTFAEFGYEVSFEKVRPLMEANEASIASPNSSRSGIAS